MPWYHLRFAAKAASGYNHILRAVSGAPVVAYYGFSKPLGKEFAAPAPAALAPLGGSLKEAFERVLVSVVALNIMASTLSRGEAFVNRAIRAPRQIPRFIFRA